MLTSPSPPMSGLQERSRLWIVSSLQLYVRAPWIVGLSQKDSDEAECRTPTENSDARRLSTWPRHSRPGVLVPFMTAGNVQEYSGHVHASGRASDRETMLAMWTSRCNYSAEDLLRACFSSSFLRRRPGVMDLV